MKIAYIYDAVYPWVKGGAEKRIYEISRRLAARGHVVHCYGMKWWPGDDTIQRDGVQLHGICRPVPLYSNGRRSIGEAVRFASRVLSLRADVDVLDCQNFPYLSCFSARLLSGRRGPRLFITWHEVWGDYWYEYLGRKGAIGRSIERAAARLTDRNIAVSERTRKDLEGLGAKGVQVLPNGIDFGAIERITASKRESDVIYAGRLVGHKNVDLLLQALKLVQKEVPDLRAVIVGDGPEMGKLKSLSRQLDLEKNVEFTGFLENYDNALALMKSSRLFASPSIREGFGMAALEANACGLPVVTVRHRMNAVSDLLTVESGMLCDLSEDDLAKSILLGLEKGRSMSEGCLQSAKRYDWDAICLQAEEIYES